MARYKVMEYGKPTPAWVDDDFCAAGSPNTDAYTVAVGRLRVELTKEERDRTIETWRKIDAGLLSRDG